MYRIAVLAMNAPLTTVPLKDDRHDLLAMAASCEERTALVYVGNPNNPTGTYVGRSILTAYFEKVPAHVLTVVDEAYFEYVRAADYPDCLDFLRAGRNVIVLRTFSKIHGLAGLRLGYGVTSPGVATAIEAVRSPFNTSAVAQAAALAALEDTEHAARCREENYKETQFVLGELRKRGLSTLPTVANFFLLQGTIPGVEMYEKLLRLGVIVRPVAPYGYPNAVRVTIGTREENTRFLEALDEVLGLRGGGDAPQLG